MIPSLSLNHKEGLSFVIIGDFGPMQDLSNAEKVFDSIAFMKNNADLDSPKNFDFFITVGDNIYPADEDYPTEEEFESMMNLFLDRPAIKDIPIYPVRGNHDCYFENEDLELKLVFKYPTWQMPEYFMLRDFPINRYGDKFSLLQVDSCFLLC